MRRHDSGPLSLPLSLPPDGKGRIVALALVRPARSHGCGRSRVTCDGNGKGTTAITSLQASKLKPQKPQNKTTTASKLLASLSCLLACKTFGGVGKPQHPLRASATPLFCVVTVGVKLRKHSGTTSPLRLQHTSCYAMSPPSSCRVCRVPLCAVPRAFPRPLPRLVHGRLGWDPLCNMPQHGQQTFAYTLPFPEAHTE